MYAARKILFITTVVFFIVITLVLPATPSFSRTDNPTWDLTQAFREALLNQESKNQQILLPLLVITFLLLGLIIYWARAQKRSIKESKKGSWSINDYMSVDNPGEKRRAWLRLPVNQYFLYARDEAERYKKSKTVNISGGGLLFATDQELEKNDKLIINIEITPGKKINLVGEAVWISENPADSADGCFLVGIRFVNIQRGDQDNIVRRILKKQQEIITQERRKNQSECTVCGMPLPAENREENRSLCPRCRAEEGDA